MRFPEADTCACCGTHVHTTGAVGQIKVVGVQKYKSGVRVSILCGRRALAYENAMLDQAKAAGHALSVPTEELSGAVERMLGERDRLRAQNDALGMRIFDLLAQREAKNAIRVVRRAARRARAQGRRSACRRREGGARAHPPRGGLELRAVLRNGGCAPDDQSPLRGVRRQGRRAEGHDAGRSLLRHGGGNSGKP